VAVEAPSYLAALQSFRLFGARFEELPLTANGIDPEQLRQAIHRHRPAFVYLIPTFQNPAGVCYDESTRAAVAAALRETGIPLLEDEPYRELVYEPVDRGPCAPGWVRATPGCTWAPFPRPASPACGSATWPLPRTSILTWCGSNNPPICTPTASANGGAPGL
jgi:2-aminoadipate transaminase